LLKRNNFVALSRCNILFPACFKLILYGYSTTQEFKLRGKDIKIGEEYCIRYGIRGRVLGTCLPRKNYSGVQRKDGVEVMLIDSQGNDSHTTMYSSQDVKELWADRTARQELRRLKNEIRDQAYSACTEKMNDYEQRLRQAGIEVDRTVCSSYGHDVDPGAFLLSISIQSNQMERLLAMLEQPEAQQRGQQFEPETAEAPSSALEQLFC